MGKLRKILALMLIIIIPFAGLKAQIGADLDANQLRLIKKTSIGEKVLDATLENSKGHFITLDSLLQHSNITYIYFWTSWNEDCLKEISKIEEKKNTLPDGVQIIYVSFEDDKKKWFALSKSIGLIKDSYFINSSDTTLLPFTLAVMDFEGNKMITKIAPAVVKLDSDKMILNRNVQDGKNNNPIESIFFQMPPPETAIEYNIAQTRFNKHQDSTLVLVFRSDQNVRNKYPDLEQNNQITKDEKDRIYKVWNQVDSTNLYIIEHLIAENKGWISKDSVSGVAAMAQFLTIQHANLKIQLKYLKMIRKAVKDKKAQGEYLAILEDRILERQHKKQKYGTQLTYVDANGNIKPVPIRNRWKVNKRRKKIGLNPI